MKKNLLSKTLVMGVIILFVGAGVVSGVNENVEKVSIGTKNGAKDTLDINDGLVGYWSFDFETAEDESSNNNDGTVNGAVSVDGISGKALNFDGVNDYVDITDSSDFEFANQGLTFSAWVQIVDNADHYRGFMTLADANSQYGYPVIKLGKSRSGHLEGRIYMQIKLSAEQQSIAFSNNDGNTLPKNEWIYLTGIVDYPNSLKLYVNGEFQESDDLLDFDMSDANNLDLNFGAYPFPGWQDEYGRHNGLIDEVRIYDRALSEDEIQELYNNSGCLETTIMIGRIHNLDTDVGDLMTFEALKLRCIQFSPFEFKKYSTGEKIKISEDYKGLLTPSFAFGIFNANV